MAKCIALTFDDGPGPATPRLLDTLDRRGVHVTFFVVGESAAAHPEVVRRECRAGHEVGNHTYDHPHLPALTVAEIRSEVGRAQQVIGAACGDQPRLLRPPYGATSVAESAAVGLPQILWSVDTAGQTLLATVAGLPGREPQAIPAGLHSSGPGTVITHEAGESAAREAQENAGQAPGAPWSPPTDHAHSEL